MAEQTKKRLMSRKAVTRLVQVRPVRLHRINNSVDYLPIDSFLLSREETVIVVVEGAQLACALRLEYKD